MTYPMVIGLGSHHGDDQAGWLIVEKLRALGYPEKFLRNATQSVDVLDELHEDGELLVCDAAESNHAPGTIHRWRWPAPGLNSLRCSSTHDLGLVNVLELATTLNNGRTPRVEIWGVEGRDWSPGALPSNVVREAAEKAAESIWSLFQSQGFLREGHLSRCMNAPSSRH